MTSEPRLSTRAVRGGIVTLAGQGTRIIIQIASTVILARLLPKEAFGMVAGVMAVVGIGDIFRDLGLSAAAVQAKRLSRGQRDNLFWINSAMGLVLSLIALASTPLIVAAYDHPAHDTATLVAVTHVLAFTFLLNGMSTQFRADLNRRMLFTRVAISDVIAPAFGLAVATTMALMGLGVWALVGQMIGQLGLLLILLIVNAGWLPRWYQRGERMGGLLKFGWQLVGAQVVTYLGSNIDNLTIGHRFGFTPLGNYTQTWRLLMTPLGQIRGPLTQVALPVLSKLQDDARRYQAFVVRGQLAMGYSFVAALGVAIGGSVPLVAVLLGDKWSQVAPLMTLLAIASVCDTLDYVVYWVFVSKAQAHRLMHLSAMTVVLRVIFVVGGSVIGGWLNGSTGGVQGVAAGYALTSATTWPISLWWVAKYTDLDSRPLYTGAARIVGLTVLVAGGAWVGAQVSGGLPAIVSLLFAAVGGVVGYALAAVVPAMRRDMREMVMFVKVARNRAAG